MFRLNFVLLCILSVSCAFKVMTVDLYHNLQNDEDFQLKNIVKVIQSVNPDIITVQKTHGWSYGNPIVRLKGLKGEGLGSNWKGVKNVNGSCDPNLAVFTRHEIVGSYEHTPAMFNTRIRLNDTGLEVSVWSVALTYQNYIYNAMNTKNVDSTGATRDAIVANEKNRVYQVVDLLKNPAFVKQIKNSNNIPVIIAGDFNSPSDLDWIQDTKDKHFGAVIDWPAPKLLRNSAGMTDSYRKVYPDASAHPGITYAGEWPSGFKEERVHHIYYRGSITPTSSYTRNMTTAGDPIFAVVTEFENIPHLYESNPSFFVNPQYNDRKFTPIGDCVVERF